MIKYIAYCRKSTDEKEKQVLSIDQQIAELKEFAQRENLEILEFLTEAQSAKIPGRPVFNDLVKRIEKSEVSGIVSWNPDRLARNSVDGGKIIYLLDLGKLESLKFPTHWFENTPQGRFMLSIAFGQAKYYVDNLSQNVQRGLRYKIKRGIWPARAPWGYRNDRNTGTIVIHPHEAMIIRKAYELYATRKYSLFDIGQFFYENGIKNKLTGGPPNDSNLRRILMRPLYYGAMVFKGELYEGIHDPIVSKTLFDQVQKVIKQRGWHHKPAKRYDFPFTGFIKCGYCGCSITAEHRPFYFPRTHNKVTYIYYHCTKKRLPCLQKGYTREEVLEKQFREIIQSVSLSQTWADKMLELLENDAKTEKQQAKQELEKLNLELTEIEQKLDRLLEAYLDTLIDGENYKQKKNELMEKQSILKDKISQLKAGNLFWVESVKEFINCAQECAKIARAENNGHLLSQMAKKVGSKYFLKDHRIEFSLWPPYKALAASAGAASATELSDRILNNGKMKGKRWLLLLDREIVFNHTSPQKESVDAFISSLPFDANELVFKTVNNGGVWATFATNKNFYLDVSAAIKKAGGSVFAVVPQDVTSFEKESKVDLPGLLKDSGTYRRFDFLH
jgi:DNA invertase Pin-like site-specific DNA recombinase